MMKKSSLKSGFSLILAWILFIIPFWGLTYTSDWDGYARAFAEPGLSRDFLFGFLAEKLNQMEYTFADFYKLHIVVIGGLYTLLFKRLRLKPIIATMIVVTIYYVPIGNQIRFFVALPLTILSLYQFINKKYAISLLELAMALLAHKTALIFFLCCLLFGWVSKKEIQFQKKWIVIANIGIVILLLLGYSFASMYGDYYHNKSSLFGGGYNTFIYLIPLCFIFKINKTIQQIPRVACDSFYRFLYVVSIGTSVFLLGGLSIQILTNRFIATLIPVWMAYFAYCSSIPEFSFAIRRRIRYYSILSVLVVYIKQYMVDILLGFDDVLTDIHMMLQSYQLS